MRAHNIEGTAQALVVAGVITPDQLQGAISAIESYWQNAIAIIWEIEDVRLLNPSLTDDECREVLAIADSNHDANYGINWEVLDASIQSHFPDGIRGQSRPT
ncbi:MAG: hypothetical protein HC851_22040 [Acaryochloris sp. RU_4_1]|nr:hypothetical protein [Acaryochloris sp. RU_4_1]NJR55666.1 hypothetical protein [Acaryochloris sp. CRU_2_0]